MILEVALSNYLVDYNGCWRWLTGLFSDGYGQVFIHKNTWKDGKTFKAHRVFYEHFKGTIPKDLVIDHLCRVKDCVNPAHLEAVTDAENIYRGTAQAAINKRKTHCINGHKLTFKNRFQSTVAVKKRACRKCHLIKGKIYRKLKISKVRGEMICLGTLNSSIH